MASGGPGISCQYHPEAALVEDYHAGDTICSACGLVVGDRVIDVGSEWRTFSNDKNSKDASRVGDAENELLGGGLSSMIAVDTKAASSYDESGNLKYRNRRTGNSSDRTLINAFREIAQMADRLKLSRDIPDRANALFKQVHDTKALKGRNNEAIVSACLYIACRKEGVTRSYKEICAVSRSSKKEIGRTFKLILKHVPDLEVEHYSTTDFISRFCAFLGLPMPVQKAALHISSTASELDVVAGRSPTSIAAAAIYMASQASTDRKSQKEIGDVAGVAEATIKQVYKLMLPEARRLFPKDYAFTTPIETLPAN